MVPAGPYKELRFPVWYEAVILSDYLRKFYFMLNAQFYLFTIFSSLHTMSRLCKKGGFLINSMSLQYTYFVEEYENIHEYVAELQEHIP